MKNNKGFAPIAIVLIIVAVLALGGVAYFAGKSSSPVPQNVQDNNYQPIVNTTTQNTTSTPTTITDKTSNWKTYTNTKLGYSFQYPEKLYLDTPTIVDSVFLSHLISFENRDGGCDMKGDSELSKTLGDFGMSISIVSGKVNPPYVDGNYSKGVLNGVWSYMGAEGCGQTSYYFPISGNRTLVIEKTQVQMLSTSATPETRAKVLAVPGVISNEESKVIFDQILSTFKFLNSGAVAENMVVKVYFAPQNSEQLGCNDVVALERTVPKTVSAGTTALEELFKGPTTEEKAKGYFTAIPVGSKLNSLTIINGEARADFNNITESGGGSCSMGIRTTQIRQTLLQFPTIKTVLISINGRTKDIFQP